MRKRNQGANVQYKDPFAPAMEAAQNTNQWLQKSQAEDIAKAQFAEGMQLNRDKFGEQQSQNAFSREMQNKRYGLAAAANARAAAAAKGGMTANEKHLAKLAYGDMAFQLGRDPYTGKPHTNKSGKGTGGALTTGQRSGLNTEHNAAADTYFNELISGGMSFADAKAQTQKGFTPNSSALNLFSNESSWYIPN